MMTMTAAWLVLLAESEAVAPDNPRLLWLRGQSEGYAPQGAPPLEAQQRQVRALTTCTRGLQLMPHWHYLRDILMPQIQAAKVPRD